MKTLFDRDPVWFAVGWISIYVLGFGSADTLTESLGVPKLLTCAVGLLLTLVLLSFVRKWNLFDYLGLCSVKGNGRDYFYFIPLIVISSVNLWTGVILNVSALEAVLYILSMGFVGILEELIFRGLLFKGMSEGGLTTAMIISSLTFGMGHAANLLLGEPVLDTALQLIYATAIGFCFTAIFHVCGSMLPCIISHIFVNATSIFAVEPSSKCRIIIAVIVTVIGLFYGFWLLKREEKGQIPESHSL